MKYIIIFVSGAGYCHMAFKQYKVNKFIYRYSPVTPSSNVSDANANVSNQNHNYCKRKQQHYPILCFFLWSEQSDVGRCNWIENREDTVVSNAACECVASRSGHIARLRHRIATIYLMFTHAKMDTFFCIHQMDVRMQCAFNKKVISTTDSLRNNTTAVLNFFHG